MAEFIKNHKAENYQKAKSTEYIILIIKRGINYVRRSDLEKRTFTLIGKYVDISSKW